MTNSLAIIIPVFNEMASVERVFAEWFQTLVDLKIDFQFLFIDDGSTDGSFEVLRRIESQHSRHVRTLRQANRGHGAACVVGYRWALENNFAFTLQIDSDGQCDPRYFSEFWSRRSHGVLFGVRTHREDGFRRRVVSRVLGLVIYLCTGIWTKDANVPYRLIRTPLLLDLLDHVPDPFFLANALITVLLQARYRILWIPIGFRNRFGGTPSLKTWGLIKKSISIAREFSRVRSKIKSVARLSV
jgi:dolichol-phosphate mannosyltransferase